MINEHLCGKCGHETKPLLGIYDHESAKFVENCCVRCQASIFRHATRLIRQNPPWYKRRFGRTYQEAHAEWVRKRFAEFGEVAEFSGVGEDKLNAGEAERGELSPHVRPPIEYPPQRDAEKVDATRCS